MDEHVMGLPAVLAATSLGKSLLYQLIAAGKFPRGIALSARRRGWLASEVAAWVTERAAERRAA